jgi:4-phytase / acid phosphatase
MTLPTREIDQRCSRHCHQRLAGAFLILALPFFFTLCATAQNCGQTLATASSVTAHNAMASPTPVAENNPPPGVGQIELVVALFRHGVRSPLQDMDSQHSGKAWPNQQDWGVDWGDLTEQGTRAATALGAYYGAYYLSAWPRSFKVYFWADVDERTVATAEALADGLKTKNIAVQITPAVPSKTPDLLFHPFKAECGVPDPKKLRGVAGYINDHRLGWVKDPAISREFNNLYAVLSCNPAAQPSDDAEKCKSLKAADDSATYWQGKPPRQSSPIQWKEKFSFASTATEAFLLEYADNMPPEKVGWGSVLVGKTGAGHYELSDLLPLHEFYFQQTDREPYLAQIGGSNLLREILDQINKKAGYKSQADGQCPRPTDDSQFVGFVGHDTNLANMNVLLKVGWDFADAKLPPSLRQLSANDALPAGALVFELRKGPQGPGSDRVRIEYVTQSLDEMKNSPEKGQPSPFRVRTTCRDDASRPLSPCVMTLKSFNNLVEKAIGPHNPFLSRCEQGKQTCP